MKIRELINVYEKLLPIYKKAYNEDWCYFDLMINKIHYGLCWSSLMLLNTIIIDTVKEYYKNYIDNDKYIFPRPLTGKDLKPRIDFMESEIKDLKRLIKKGYTHI